MLRYRCVPIKTEVVERFRTGLQDDAGSALIRVVDDDGGLPCRHCLRETAPGEPALLGSYHLERPKGIYWTPSPIFVHERACQPYTEQDRLPPIVLTRLVSLRAYDSDHRAIYELGEVQDSNLAEDALARCLGDPRTEFVSIHTAKPGCLLCAVERVD